MNAILETIVDAARRERKQAVRDGDYGWALFSALVETWAASVARNAGGSR